ncbi:MAG: DUF438 domain-containing protein [Bacteroidales bacterium]|nr:DUF438 domain-containing protein [Bacteroidales bacterium]
MSELINNNQSRKELLKHMILQLHEGVAPEAVKARLIELMSKVPYGLVVEVEQELINEGLPEEEVLRLCDVHTQALEGHIDLSAMKIVAPGHPVDTFKQENRELEKVAKQLQVIFESIDNEYHQYGSATTVNKIRGLFNSLTDVDKHYRRKENLLFPFLEKYGITGPPKVMWGKHDETRDLLKNALHALDMPSSSADQMKLKIEVNLQPAAKAITDMIMKEEEILFPMTLDKLTETDWYEIYQQTNEIGYCLFDPQIEWKPSGVDRTTESAETGNEIKLPSGRFSNEELLSLLNTVPFDMTFVDRDDKVKYFSQGKERIFDRNRAILGRDVRMCHPPSSVHIVDQIIADFKSGKADSAPFWINLGGKFIHIEYFALRNPEGEYLGTLEVSQELTEKRSLQGDQRLLSYRKKESGTEIVEPIETTKNVEIPKAGELINKINMNKPQWLDRSHIKITLDARPLLAQGIHPLERVQQEAATLNSGEVYEIITPFPPMPMIEKLEAAGFTSFSEQVEGLFHTFFLKAK